MRSAPRATWGRVARLALLQLLRNVQHGDASATLYYHVEDRFGSTPVNPAIFGGRPLPTQADIQRKQHRAGQAAGGLAALCGAERPPEGQPAAVPQTPRRGLAETRWSPLDTGRMDGPPLAVAAPTDSMGLGAGGRSAAPFTALARGPRQRPRNNGGSITGQVGGVGSA